MATTPVTMQVKDFTDREVMMLTYAFDQDIDKEGQMSGIPRGGKIHVKVKALNDGNPQLLGWMLEPTLAKDVTFTFMDTKANKQMKTIEVSGGYCVDFHENWTDDQQHYEEIVISCQNIKFQNIEFKNAWA